MNTIRLLPLALIALTPVAKASVVLNLYVGQLFEANGSAPVSDGALIQLIASTQDAVFTAPTLGNFTGGSSDDFVLMSFALNSASGGAPGSFIKAIDSRDFLQGTPLINQGTPLMLRWFPELTTSSTGTIAGTQYGQFRSDAKPDNSDITWNMPADGTYTLKFLTESLAGSNLDSAGAASYVVTAVPEPSTYGLVGAGALAAVAAVRRRRKR